MTQNGAVKPIVSGAGVTKLNYLGGPVISNVNIVPIFYGAAGTVDSAIQLPTFYGSIANSTYFDWLSEYNTPTQSIGRGTVSPPITVTTNLLKSLDDVKNIQPLLKSLVTSGKITPTANTYYPIHFAPGISVTLGRDKSCVQFCAYHGTIALGAGKFLYYGVIPDQGGSCASILS